MLKIISSTFAILVFLTPHAEAACYEDIASACEKGYCVDIGWNCEIRGYEKDIRIAIRPIKRTKNAEGEYINMSVGEQKVFRFLDECQWRTDFKNSFTCHVGGNTFLAGRSYKRQRHGNTKSCPDPDTGKIGRVPNYRFACISGCTKDAIFGYLKDDRIGDCH